MMKRIEKETGAAILKGPTIILGRLMELSEFALQKERQFAAQIKGSSKIKRQKFHGLM